MDFDTEHIKGLQNLPIKSILAEPRKSPETMPGKPFLGVVCGSRGSGKSTALINLVKLYAPYHFFDKIILFSPTYMNDVKLQTLEDDERYKFIVYTEPMFELIEETLNHIKHEIEEYKEMERYLKIYNKMVRAKNVETYLRKLDPADLALLHIYDFQPPESEYEYGMPQTLIIFDDCVGVRAVYNNQNLNKFLLQHRHYLTSFIFAVQQWKGALPRGIRNNLSLALLFSNKSKEIRKEIAGELSAYITADQLEQIWDFCCESPHDFMMVDFDNPKYRFRKNFDTLIKIK